MNLAFLSAKITPLLQMLNCLYFFLFREYFISFCNQTHVDKTLHI